MFAASSDPRGLQGRRHPLVSTTGLNEYLQRLGWPDVQQAFQITREVCGTDRITGERTSSREVVYGITSLIRD